MDPQRCVEASLGRDRESVEQSLSDLQAGKVIERIWQLDHTVWKPAPDGITDRLGWLRYPESVPAPVQDTIRAFAEEARQAGVKNVLLLGMGGSSLGPEVLAETFEASSTPDSALQLRVLDSTDPGAVQAQADRLDPRTTLFLVSTKSGGTVETLSFFNFFHQWVASKLGRDRAGAHFAAVTDPGSRLQHLAQEFDFRAVFLNDPEIGGRFSVLSMFGLVPAALIGVDIGLLLERASRMSVACRGPVDDLSAGNPGARLGAIMGEMTRLGRNKLTLICSPRIERLADWIEQLVAESTGKEGRGIVPVAGEPVGPPTSYGNDRLFVEIRLFDDPEAPGVQALRESGHPLVRLRLQDPYDLGIHFFLWEMATAIAGHALRVNPFDQPDVESAKSKAREMVASFKRTGSLPEEESERPSAERLAEFLAGAHEGDYLAIQAYLNPNAETREALEALRASLRKATGLAVTVGFGPRFLHSTGQLHKGDSGNGLFLQLTGGGSDDLAIPDTAGSDVSSMTFGVLKAAQAGGDRRALEEAGRRLLWFDLGADPPRQLIGLCRAG